MTTISEIAPDLFRLSIDVPDYDLQFHHFLVRDEESLLFHAGFKRLFPALCEAVATLIDLSRLRSIAWSHFESDDIGAHTAPATRVGCGPAVRGDVQDAVLLRPFSSFRQRCPGDVVRSD